MTNSFRSDRRDALKTISSGAVLAAVAAQTASTQVSASNNDAQAEPLDIIDCHTHFYDPSRPEGVPWPPKNTRLYRTVLPRDLRALPMYRRVTGTVAVEASVWLEDNAWLLELAKDDPFIVGIVGNIDPHDAEFAKHLKRFAANKLYRGIRINYNKLEPLAAQNRLDTLKPLAELDLELDVNGGLQKTDVVPKIAAAIPNLRIVVNHVGNVALDTNGPPKDWVDKIRATAAHENTYCKISALVEGAARNGKVPPKELDFYRPYIDTVWNAFGDDRVIYGSNWPVSERAADYATLQKIVLEYAGERGPGAMAKFCSLNAKGAYKWIERAGRRVAAES